VVLARHADELRWRSAAVLVEDGGPLDGLAEVLNDSIRNVVDEVPLFRRTARDRTDWTGVYDEAASADVDLVLQFRRQLDTTPVKQWATQERPFELGGLDIGLQAHEA
jgi:branched-chain amino acid transport system substrate-binding protein